MCVCGWGGWGRGEWLRGVGEGVTFSHSPLRSKQCGASPVPWPGLATQVVRT